jgi:hypothetical protein
LALGIVRGTLVTPKRSLGSSGYFKGKLQVISKGNFRLFQRETSGYFRGKKIKIIRAGIDAKIFQKVATKSHLRVHSSWVGDCFLLRATASV